MAEHYYSFGGVSPIDAHCRDLLAAVVAARRARWQIAVGTVTGLGLVAVLAAPRLRASPAPALTALAVKGIPPILLVWLGASIATALSGMAAAHLPAHRINPVHARRAATTLAALTTLFTLIHDTREQCPWIRNA